MPSQKYLINRTDTENSLNVVNLLKQAKLERKQEKRKHFLVATVAISALAISGLIITL